MDGRANQGSQVTQASLIRVTQGIAGYRATQATAEYRAGVEFQVHKELLVVSFYIKHKQQQQVVNLLMGICFGIMQRKLMQRKLTLVI